MGTTLRKRLARKIEREAGIKVDENVFVRTYAGKHQKASGAFLWYFALARPGIGIVGSCFTATECLRKDRRLEAEDRLFGEYEIFPENVVKE